MVEKLKAHAELPEDPSVIVEDHVLRGPPGTHELRVRVYTPSRRRSSLGPWSFSMAAGTSSATWTTSSPGVPSLLRR